MPLTPAQRARIAKWCGHKFNGPDYGNSLDACAEFEARAAERGLEDDYVHHLYGVVVGFGNPAMPSHVWMFRQVTATAEQRAEAILRVIEQQEGQG